MVNLIDTMFQLALTYPQWILYLEDDSNVEQLLQYLLEIRSEQGEIC